MNHHDRRFILWAHAGPDRGNRQEKVKKGINRRSRDSNKCIHDLDAMRGSDYAIT